MTNRSTRDADAAGKDAKTTTDMEVVSVFAKNRFDEVWAYVQPFMGHQLAHIRIFSPGDDDEMHPTHKGVSINIRDLPKLADSVAALVAAVEARES